MNNGIVITISRQFGSGGRNIAKQLAKILDIPFYDQELIVEGAKESGLDPDMVKVLEETSGSGLLYSFTPNTVFGGAFSPVVDLPMTDKVFLAQSEAIRKFAQEGSCVIVGRCANYVLRDFPDVLNVFIHRDFEERVNQTSKLFDLNKKKSLELVKKTDKQRASYYSYYTDNHWGLAENYDLSLDSGKLGEDGSVFIIKSFLEKMELRNKSRQK